MLISNEFFNLYSKWWTRMDANFMSAKEMKYNVERKKITFTWKREEEKITYILLCFIHNLLLFTARQGNTCKAPLLFTRSFYGLLFVDFVFFRFLLCLERFWSRRKRGQSSRDRAAKLSLERSEKCWAIVREVGEEKIRRWQQQQQKKKIQLLMSKNVIDNGIVCKVMLLPHLKH